MEDYGELEMAGIYMIYHGIGKKISECGKVNGLIETSLTVSRKGKMHCER